MAETSLRSLLLLTFYVSLSSAISSSQVTFVGFLNEQRTFSALLEVDLDFEVGSRNWLASLNRDCKDIYATVSKVDQGPNGSSKAGLWRTLQLLLPVQRPHQTSPELHLCYQDEQGSYVALPQGFQLPKVTVNEVLNKPDYDEQQYVLEPLEGKSRQSRALEDDEDEDNIASNVGVNGTESDVARVVAFRLQSVSKDVGYTEDGIIEALIGHEVPLILFGEGFNNDTKVVFTSAVGSPGGPCSTTGSHIKTPQYGVKPSLDGLTATLTIPGSALPLIEGQDMFYICVKGPSTNRLYHQGSDNIGLQIQVYNLLLPIWLMVIFIGILLCLSGLFSGLNLGLMALDQTELKIVQNTGTDDEKEYAKKIFPIRVHGNFLLCSLLLGNVLVNNTLTILLDTLTSGLVAVIGATMGIVVFGEIIPQAICSRHGLAVGAYTIWLTKFFMVLTFPLSYPISKLLDVILGDEIGTVYDKKKLIELLRVTKDENDLEKEEVDIVTGALIYKEKTVSAVMTKLEDCYMLPLKTILNFDTVSEIREQGYSRIPVYDGERENIKHVLFAKDLMFIDPDDNMPLSMVCSFYDNDVNFVFHDTTLNVMFNEFKSGEKGHMAFVQEVNTCGDGDPFYETVGLITLEDIIEEIIQQEIVDETDVVTDNRTKKKRRRENFKSGPEGTTFHQMFGGESTKKITISPQVTLAVFQYLTTSIDPFKATYFSEVVLKRLLTMDIYHEIKVKKDSSGKKVNTCEEDLIIMTKGKAADFFVLIIEGKVEVNIGREELKFEAGPFTYFGIQTLNQVIESPSSPLLAHRASQAIAAGNSADVRNLRKASTQQSIDIPSHVLSNKRSSTSEASLHHHAAHQSRAGSVVPTFQTFIPDYTIKAVTDVLYLKIKRTTYLRALKASLMGKKTSHSGELNERELENLLEKVEDEDTDLNMMLRTPVAHSPNQSTGGDHEVTRVRVSNSGASTPTIATRGDPTRMSLASKRSEIEEEFWASSHDNKTNMMQMTHLKLDTADTVAATATGSKSEANGEAIKEEASPTSEECKTTDNLLNADSNAS